MITEKLSKNIEDKFIRIAFKRYVKQFGYGIRNLDQYEIWVTSGSRFEDEMPEIVEYENDTKRYLLIDILQELFSKGFVKNNRDNTIYYFTESGYNYASRNWWERILTYFNKNAGLALIIALLSLIVSIIAIFK